MRSAHYKFRVLGAVCVSALVLLASTASDRPGRTLNTGARDQQRRAAAVAALDLASARDAAATESLRRARSGYLSAHALAASRHLTLARADRALAMARRANSRYVYSLTTATAAAERARVAYDAAHRAAVSSEGSLRSATAARDAANLAVTRADDAVTSAEQRVADLLGQTATPSPSSSLLTPAAAAPAAIPSTVSAEPSVTAAPTSPVAPRTLSANVADPALSADSSTGATPSDSTLAANASSSASSGSTDLAEAEAALASARAALAAAQNKAVAAHNAYNAAVARSRYCTIMQARAAATLGAARARVAHIVAVEPRSLKQVRTATAAAAASYQRAASLLRARTAGLHNATLNLVAASAAFHRATSAALVAVRSVAISPQCRTGNIYANASTSRVLSVPGLTITQYHKAGRMPMWVTTANTAGAGSQIRPALLPSSSVTAREPQSRRLVGSRAIAAVNGDFFFGDNSPWGPEVGRGGRIIKGSSSPVQKALVLQNNGIADVTSLAVDTTIHHGASTVAASRLNSSDMPANGIAVLNGNWGRASRAHLGLLRPVYEYFVSSRGIVTNVKPGISASPTPPGGMVIVAQGSARARLTAAGIGRSARISVTARVRTPVHGGVYSAIGVGMVLMQDGIDARLGCAANHAVARTIVGIKPGGQSMFVVTVEGQTDSAGSGFNGLTVQQAQGLMRSLGAFDAAMFDGGGSTILTARVGRAYRILSRSPSGSIRPLSNSLAFWAR